MQKTNDRHTETLWDKSKTRHCSSNTTLTLHCSTDHPTSFRLYALWTRLIKAIVSTQQQICWLKKQPDVKTDQTWASTFLGLLEWNLKIDIVRASSSLNQTPVLLPKLLESLIEISRNNTSNQTDTSHLGTPASCHFLHSSCSNDH